MTGYSRGVIWFNRFVLAAATFVMTMIALRNLRDPIGATLPLEIALGSPSAVTIVRVGFGGRSRCVESTRPISAVQQSYAACWGRW